MNINDKIAAEIGYASGCAEYARKSYANLETLRQEAFQAGFVAALKQLHPFMVRLEQTRQTAITIKLDDADIVLRKIILDIAKESPK